jgi:foldase protein PrsA
LKKKLVILVVAAAFVFTMFAGCGSSNDTVATVAGEKITSAEYKFILANVKSNMEKQQNLADDAAKQKFWTTTSEGKSMQDVAKDQALDTAKVLKIHLIKAKESNLVLDAKDLSDVKSAVDNITKSMDSYIAQGQDKSMTREKLFLQQYGVNQQQFEDIYKEFMLQSKYVQAEEKKINVTDDEIKKQYDDNKDKYDKVTAQHILFMTVDQNQKPLAQDKIDAAKKNADDILARVKAGEDFGTLAKQYSEDPGSKDNNGEYTFGKGEMVPEFENWAFSAKPGDTGIVKSSFGYHVMKLIKHLTLDDVKDTVKTDVINDKYSKQVDDLKKDPKYNVTTTKLYDSIKVIQ